MKDLFYNKLIRIVLFLSVKKEKEGIHKKTKCWSKPPNPTFIKIKETSCYASNIPIL